MKIETTPTVIYSLTEEESKILRKAVNILELLEENYETAIPAYDNVNDKIMNVSTGDTFNLNNLIIGLNSVWVADETNTTILK